MANEQQQTQPQVAIPLPKGKKNAVQIGCICMMLSVAMYGLVFATLTSPILESVNAMGYVSLFSIFAGMGVSIMTPIGGKLGDLIGRRKREKMFQRQWVCWQQQSLSEDSVEVLSQVS